ncbi:DUF2721 domain-containing protein [Caenorhabditis elegans]|nr:DUF2721 domain-containing protein [Caenorhabditis elegans]CCW45961.1 DUF2721 domain-containing protein [Caenorhabditis elegans]|eukprot:NP_001294071.1 Uncharacterized protein CELE_F11E6.11 [Caenorhabditis elegans]
MILAGVGILSDVVITFINLHRKIKYSQDIEKDIEQTTKIKEEKTALLSIFQKSIRLSMFGLSIIGFFRSFSVFFNGSIMPDCSYLVIWPTFVLSFLILLLSIFVIIYYSCIACCTILDRFDENYKH